MKIIKGDRTPILVNHELMNGIVAFQTKVVKVHDGCEGLPGIRSLE